MPAGNNETAQCWRAAGQNCRRQERRCGAPGLDNEQEAAQAGWRPGKTRPIPSITACSYHPPSTQTPREENGGRKETSEYKRADKA